MGSTRGVVGAGFDSRKSRWGGVLSVGIVVGIASIGFVPVVASAEPKASPVELQASESQAIEGDEQDAATTHTAGATLAESTAAEAKARTADSSLTGTEFGASAGSAISGDASTDGSSSFQADNGISHDSATNTYTLSGYTSTSPLRLGAGATIVLAEGTTNTISVENAAALDAQGVTIKGPGTLELTATGNGDTGSGDWGDAGTGIFSLNGGITITDGAQVRIIAGYRGVYTDIYEDVTVSGGASLEIASGMESIFSGGDLAIDGASSVTATSAASDALLSEDGDISISGGGSVTVNASENGINSGWDLSIGGVKLKVTAGGSAVVSEYGDVTMTDVKGMELAPGKSGVAIRAEDGLTLAGCSGSVGGSAALMGRGSGITLRDCALDIAASRVAVGSSIALKDGTALTVPANAYLTVDAGKALSIGRGCTLTNNGSISCSGELSVAGALVNNGEISFAEGSSFAAESGAKLAAGKSARVVVPSSLSESSGKQLNQLGAVSVILTKALDFSRQDQKVSGTGYAWDPATKTLMLDNATIDLDASDAPGTAAIILPAGATIRLADGTTSNIAADFGTADDADGTGLAIRALGDLSIKGSGKLVISGDAESVTADGDLLLCGITLDSRTRGGISANSIAARHSHLLVTTYATPVLVAAESIRVDTSDAVLSCEGQAMGSASAQAAVSVRVPSADADAADYLTLEGLPKGYAVAVFEDSEPAIHFAGVADLSTGKSALSIALSAYAPGSCDEDPEQPAEPEQPEKPGKPEETDQSKANASGKKDGSATDKLSTTGDSSAAIVGAAAVSGAILLGAGLAGARRRRE